MSRVSYCTAAFAYSLPRTAMTSVCGIGLMPPKKAPAQLTIPKNTPSAIRKASSQGRTRIITAPVRPAPRVAPASTRQSEEPEESDPDIDPRVTTLIEELDVSFQTSYRELKTELSDKIDNVLAIVTQLQNPARPIEYHSNNPLSNSAAPGSDILSRWPWIKKSTVEAIASGSFDINHLPKLHHEESARNHWQHNLKTTDGVHFPMDGGKGELVTVRTKMLTAFRDLPTFLSAWHIYMSVRSSYNPERGPGLISWTERLIHRAQIHPWPTV